MLTIKLILLAIIFVVTSGAVFSETFKRNKPLVALAAVVAIVSSYYLFESTIKILSMMLPKRQMVKK